MRSRVRWQPLAVTAVILAVWSAAQLLLARRVANEFNADNLRSYRFFLSQGRDDPRLPHPHLYVVPDSFWIRPGVESVAAALLLVAIAAVLIAGGRRWAALLVVAFPLANVLGGFDGGSLGVGWDQLGGSHRAWSITGTVVDSLMLVAVVGLLVRALPSPAATMPATTALVRSLPPVIVLTGWWLIRGMASDPDKRIWLGQAIGFVVIAALLAGSSLPLPARIVVAVGVLPLCSFALLDSLIGSGPVHFATAVFVHHAAFAAATVLYVADVPRLLARFPALDRPVRRPTRPLAG